MKAQDIKKVCCYGVGMIGTGCAVDFAWKGLGVKIYSRRQSSLDDAMNRAARYFKSLERNGVLTAEEAAAGLSRITCVTDPEEALTDVQWIQESASENFPTKHSIVELVERYADPEAIFGSSTSNMMIKDISEPAKHKERYIGAHPYNPPFLIPLIELSGSAETSPEVLKTAFDFFIKLRKKPILMKKEVPGFICNRLQNAIKREITHLVGQGAITLKDAEEAVTYGPGLRWALITPSQCQMLSSDGGIPAVRKNIGGSGINVTADLAKWDAAPPEEAEIYEAQLAEYTRTNPGGFESLEDSYNWRDDGLIMLLKFHRLL